MYLLTATPPQNTVTLAIDDHRALIPRDQTAPALNTADVPRRAGRDLRGTRCRCRPARTRAPLRFLRHVPGSLAPYDRCRVGVCVAHGLRLTESMENPNAPARELSVRCDDGSAITTTKSDFLTPNGDGSFSGERVFTVIGPGCPGDGAGTYWLPFTLTPT